MASQEWKKPEVVAEQQQKKEPESLESTPVKPAAPQVPLIAPSIGGGAFSQIANVESSCEYDLKCTPSAEALLLLRSLRVLLQLEAAHLVRTRII